MTLNCGGMGREDKEDTAKFELKSVRKSAELFAILEFLRNLKDAGVGTNYTENMAKAMSGEID